MSLRILVVEDEVKPREGLVKLIGGLGPDYEVVGQARNGAEGLELALSLTPDLVLTDVKMPAMDGLEMIAAIGKAGCGARFIILSGYADFEYARRGMSLGVKEYLLKPITKPMLEESLARIRDELRAEAPEPGSAWPRGFLVLFYVPGDFEDHKASADAILERCSRTAGAGKPTLVDRPDAQSALFLVASELPSAPFFASLEAEAHRGGRKDKEVEIACALSEPGRDPKARVAELSELLRWSGFTEGALVMHADLVAGFTTEEPEYPLPLEGAALEAVRRSKGEEIEAAVESLYLYCVSGKYAPASVSEIAYRFFFSVTNLMKELDYERFKSLIDLNILDRILRYRGAGELRSIFEEFLDGAVRCPAEPGEPFSHAVRCTLNYIKSGYRGKLSLEAAAERTGLSPEYLCKLFLKETGRNFSTYVAEYRIEKSKPLLAEGTMKTYEIASSVGISDPQYFCRVFKKYTGLTPGDYSKLHAF